MKKTLVFILFLLMLSAVEIAISEVMFEIPSNVIVIEDGAFETLNEENVFIGKGVKRIGINAFGNKVTTIYGYLASEAERYAAENGKTFCSVDIIDLAIEETNLWTVEGGTVNICPSAKSNIGDLSYKIIVKSGDTEIAELSTKDDTASFPVKLDEPGIYTIYVEANNGYDTVSAVYENSIFVEANIAFADSEIVLDAGETLPLLSMNENRNVTITGYDEDIIAVDDKSVKGLKVGTTVLSAEIDCGEGRIINGSCKITVCKPVKHTALGFDKLFITLHPGEEYRLTVSVQPSGANRRRVDFASSDESVATIDDNGILHAVSEGSAIITGVSQLSSGVSNTCKVFVIKQDALPLDGVVIGINPGHQKRGINTLYPISPGSSTMKVGCKVGTQGLVTKTPEYEVALQVSFILRDILEENGATVVMTRTTNDAYLTNIQRADILNNANVDAAIQVHCNGGATSLYGMSSYYRTTGSWVEESKWLADCMLRHMLVHTGASNAGLHVCNTYMSLNYSFTPACLVEMGYLTNAAEEQLLVSPDYQQKLAYGMYDALLEYFGR